MQICRENFHLAFGKKWEMTWISLTCVIWISWSDKFLFVCWRRYLRVEMWKGFSKNWKKWGVDPWLPLFPDPNDPNAVAAAAAAAAGQQVTAMVTVDENNRPIRVLEGNDSKLNFKCWQAYYSLVLKESHVSLKCEFYHNLLTTSTKLSQAAWWWLRLVRLRR